MRNKPIPFSPPDIGRKEIKEVVDTLRSGWITTGPKTKIFEKDIAKYCGSKKAVCLNSATAGLELTLRLFGIGPGDEVITTPYTFAATANVILHVGAKPVFVDVNKNEFNISPKNIEKAITKKTKAIIPVDFGGWPVDYNEIRGVLKSRKNLFRQEKDTLQKYLDSPLILADSAHSLGAAYYNKKIGNVADFTVFSFHAVKNLTTAEGGAVTFNSIGELSREEIYKKLKLFSLHGQSKDALIKNKAGNWEYSIELAGYKANMTDIAASLGIPQLKRYDSEIIPNRKKIFEIYTERLKEDDRFILPNFTSEHKLNSYHLFPLRINGADEEKRAEIIKKMAEKNIALNVHFKPLPMYPLYRNLGYKMADYPNAYEMYQNEISLPLYSKLKSKDAVRVCHELKKVIDKL